MRKSVAVLLSILTLGLGAPMVGIAQTPQSTLRGQVVDPGGRGTAGSRLELVSDSIVVATTISTTDGHFSFPGVPLGNYVVRTYVNGQPIGIRVAVTAGSTGTALLVLPSVATASPAVIAAVAASALGPIVGATVVAVGNTVVISEADDTATVLESRQDAVNYLAQLVINNPGLAGTGALDDLQDLVDAIIFPPSGSGETPSLPPDFVVPPGICNTASCT